MEQHEGKEYLLRWLIPSLVCLGIIFAWSNHFHNSFHWDDYPQIVDNKAIQGHRSFTQFFLRPRTSSDLVEQTTYRPLLSAAFALDYAFGGPAPRIFHVDTFVWFLTLVLVLYALFRLVPGGSHFSAVIAAGLFALHPAIADTVNYISQRGIVIAAFSIVSGLAIWIVWPRLLPARLWVDTRRTATNWQEDVNIQKVARRNARYQRFIHLPLGLYLVPVALGLLVEPSTAIFPPLLAAYIWLFESGARYRRLLPSAILCSAYLAFSTFLTWRFDAASRVPFLRWWFTEPSVAARYLFHFIYPLNLSPDSGLKPLTLAEWPLAMLGLGVILALASVVIYTARRTEWRGVSFGLCWFLIALLPAALIPGRMVESNARMFLPFIGLALACTRAAFLLVSKLAESTSSRTPVFVSSVLLSAVILSTAGWSTFQRNKIWDSEDSLWQTVVQMSPLNGRAWTHGAVAAVADFDLDRAARSLHRAEPLVAGDASLETDLALAFDLLGNDDATQKHLQLAVAAGPEFARAYSVWGEWLFKRQRVREAFTMATRATTLDPADITGQHTLTDIYSRQFNWAKVKETANKVLAIYPDDRPSQSSLVLAQSTLDAIDSIASSSEGPHTAQEYLKLSVFYFQGKRYQDSIAAARSALKINDKLGEAWANIAAAQHEIGKDDDAIAAFREVIRLRPDLTFASTNLDYLLAKKPEAASR